MTTVFSLFFKYTFMITTNSGNTALSNVVIDGKDNDKGSKVAAAASPVTTEPEFVFQDLPHQLL